MRTTVVRCAVTRTCCCSVGRKPASVTRTVYRPGVSFSPRKTPCVLVRKSTGAVPKTSGTSSTVAPNWGTPEVSLTTPAIFPAADFTCASAGYTVTTHRHIPARTHLPRIRRRACFTMLLPPARFAGVGRGFGLDRRFYHEFGSFGDRLVGKTVRGHHFQRILSGRQRPEGKQAFDGDLFAGLFHGLAGFLELHDLLVALLHRIDEAGGGLVSLFVRFQIVHLHVDAELFVAVEFTVQARHDFRRAQHELATSNLLGRHMLEFGAIGND